MLITLLLLMGSNLSTVAISKNTEDDVFEIFYTSLIYKNRSLYLSPGREEAANFHTIVVTYIIVKYLKKK